MRQLVCLAGLGSLLTLTGCLSLSDPQDQEYGNFVAEGIAESLGIPIDEAIRRLQIIEDAQSIVSALQGSDPDRFGGVYINHVPRFEVVFRIVGDTTDLPVDIRSNPEFRVEHTFMSVAGLEEVKEQIVGALGNTPGIWTAAVDHRLGKVAVVIQPNDAARRAVREAGIAPELINVEEHPMPAVRQGMVKGGGETCKKHELVGGGSAKEFGSLAFNVKDQSGLTGVLTAAHVSECKAPTGQTYKTVSRMHPYAQQMQKRTLPLYHKNSRAE